MSNALSLPSGKCGSQRHPIIAAREHHAIAGVERSAS